jgi:hypothetical protein
MLLLIRPWRIVLRCSPVAWQFRWAEVAQWVLQYHQTRISILSRRRCGGAAMAGTVAGKNGFLNFMSAYNSPDQFRPLASGEIWEDGLGEC